MTDLLRLQQAAITAGGSFALHYDAEADDGSGNGWTGEWADWHCYGTLDEVIAALLTRAGLTVNP